MVVLVVEPKCAEEDCMLLIVVGKLGAMNLAVVVVVSSRYVAPVPSNMIPDPQLSSAVDRSSNGAGTYRSVLGLPRESEE